MGMLMHRHRMAQAAEAGELGEAKGGEPSDLAPAATHAPTGVPGADTEPRQEDAVEVAEPQQDNAENLAPEPEPAPKRRTRKASDKD